MISSGARISCRRLLGASSSSVQINDASKAKISPSRTDDPRHGPAIALNSVFPTMTMRPQTTSDVARLATMFPLSVNGRDPGPHLAIIMFPLEAGKRSRPTSDPMHHPIAAPPTRPAMDASALCFATHAAITPVTAPATIAAVVAAAASAMTLSPEFSPSCI